MQPWRAGVWATGTVLLLGWLAGGLRAEGTRASPPPAPGQAVATFAGGCFWCMEAEFEGLSGVIEVRSGYTGGKQPSPSYQQVGSGRSGHVEAVEVVYDPGRVDYPKLLEVYWSNVDPTVENRQFCDVGPQYRTAIFVHDDGQRRAAEASLAALRASPRFAEKKLYTTIEAAGPFWLAESYHQDFHRTNPEHYRRYSQGCGRKARLKAIWGD